MELPIIQSNILKFNPARFNTIPCTAAYKDQSVPVSAFNPRLPTQSSTAYHRGPKTLLNLLQPILS